MVIYFRFPLQDWQHINSLTGNFIYLSMMRLANSLASNNLSNGCIQNSKWALRTDLHHINRRKSKVLQANHCALVPRRSVREIVHKTANLKCISNWSIDYLPTIHQVPVQNIATALLRVYEWETLCYRWNIDADQKLPRKSIAKTKEENTKVRLGTWE